MNSGFGPSVPVEPEEPPAEADAEVNTEVSVDVNADAINVDAPVQIELPPEPEKSTRFTTVISDEPVEPPAPPALKAEYMSGEEASDPAPVESKRRGRKPKAPVPSAAAPTVPPPVPPPADPEPAAPPVTSGGKTLTERTLAEMEAGRKALAKHRAMPPRIRPASPNVVLERDPAYLERGNVFRK